MKKREKDVIDMQITIADCMKSEWNLKYDEIGDMFSKYHLLDYIDASYEIYNSMGIKGILIDLKEFMDLQEEAG